MENEKRKPDPNRMPNHPDWPHLKVKEYKFTVPELEKKIAEYFDTLAANTKEVMSASGKIKLIADPLTPTIEHFASYLGITQRTLWNYSEAENYEDYHEIMSAAREKILGMKTLSLVNGKGSAAGLIFDLVNNHKYKNKSEVESKNENDTTIRVVYE